MPLLTDDACLDPEINVDEDGSVSNKMLVVLLGRGYGPGKISKADVSFARGVRGGMGCFSSRCLVLLGRSWFWNAQPGVTFC